MVGDVKNRMSGTSTSSRESERGECRTNHQESFRPYDERLNEASRVTKGPKLKLAVTEDQWTTKVTLAAAKEKLVV